MAFMQRDIQRAHYFEVSANHGETHVIPADVVGNPKTNADFAIYVDGRIDNPEDAPEPAKDGYVCRLSAPGYLDCTDWAAFETRAECEAYLTEMYGDDDDTESENE